MSDTDAVAAALTGLRIRERELELEAVAVKARVEEIRDMIERLEPRRRPRPRNTAQLNPVSPQSGTSTLNPFTLQPMQQGPNIVPQRVADAQHEPETTETTA